MSILPVGFACFLKRSRAPVWTTVDPLIQALRSVAIVGSHGSGASGVAVAGVVEPGGATRLETSPGSDTECSSSLNSGSAATSSEYR